MKLSPRKLVSGLLLFGLLLSFAGSGCKHLPNMDIDPFTMVDTTDNPVDTMVVDTMVVDTNSNENPCDSELIYFERDILPILISNCTTSGCHNANDAEADVVLDSYENTTETADVRPFDLGGSDLYEVITEDDPDKVMPRPPNAPLSSSQISIIAEWILQGAENLTCDDNSNACDTVDVSYSMTVEPIIVNNCRGCHSGDTPSGGIDLSDYAGVSTQALNGSLYGVTERLQGFVPMPLNAAKLPQCEVDQIKSWIDAGATNN